MENKKTLVLGASNKPSRYAYLAVQRLLSKGHKVIAVGRREGMVEGVPIQTEFPSNGVVDTVTLYLNPFHQIAYYDSILALKPQRIIFNPGTENPELVALAHNAGIETEIACTLVMLSTGQY